MHDKQLANMNDDTELMNSLLGWKYIVESDCFFCVQKQPNFKLNNFSRLLTATSYSLAKYKFISISNLSYMTRFNIHSLYLNCTGML